MASNHNSTTPSSSRSRNSRVARRNRDTSRANPYSNPNSISSLDARLHSYENRLRDMELEQEETRSTWMELANGRVAQIYQDQEDLAETMGVVHNQVIGNRNEISVLQTRLVESETRIQEAEEHAHMLQRRLEQAVGMISRLTRDLERVVALLPPPSPHQD